MHGFNVREDTNEISLLQKFEVLLGFKDVGDSVGFSLATFIKFFYLPFQNIQ